MLASCETTKTFKFYFKGECVCSFKTVKGHRVYRVPARLSVQSSELGPHTRKRVLPPLGPRGETHSLAREGLSGPKSDEGIDTLVLYV
jgi:hypothetical protein